MEQNKKYYDLIIEKIKGHRKYAGLESLLDDVANDVYERAKVIINTVTNEEVVDSYLEKTISTSLITIPKKMGFVQKQTRQVQAVCNESPLQVVEKEDDIEPLNVISNQSVDDEIFEEILDNQDEINNEILDDKSENTVVEEVISEPKVNIELVDKMINGIATDKKISEFELEDNVVDNFEAENSDMILSEENDANLNLSDDILEINDEQFEAVGEETFFENDEISDVIVNVEEPEVSYSETDNELSFDSTESLNDLDTLELQTGDEFSMIVENSEELITEDELFTDDNLDVVEEIELQNENNKITDEADTLVFNYEYFNFTPEKFEQFFDYNEFKEIIDNIQCEYKDVNIILLCDLKYKKNKTITEIAEILNKSTEYIIEILNNIADNIEV